MCNILNFPDVFGQPETDWVWNSKESDLFYGAKHLKVTTPMQMKPLPQKKSPALFLNRILQMIWTDSIEGFFLSSKLSEVYSQLDLQFGGRGI